MNSLFQAFRVEVLKAWRSRIPLFTTLGFSIGPLSAGLFMVILKDPEAARSLGVISAKAQIVAGSADWETYLGVLAQMVAIGGIIVFGFAASWVFGREYSDHTLKDLLALPTPRSSIVLAKFGVVLLWCAMMTLDVLIVGILLGFLVSLPPVLPEILRQGSFTDPGTGHTGSLFCLFRTWLPGTTGFYGPDGDPLPAGCCAWLGRIFPMVRARFAQRRCRIGISKPGVG
jgi:ABC-2 type transport system permease protein